MWVFEQLVAPGARIYTPFGVVEPDVRPLNTGGYAAVGVLRVSDPQIAEWLQNRSEDLHIRLVTSDHENKTPERPRAQKKREE